MSEDRLTKTEMISTYHHLVARRILLLVVCIIGIILFAGLFSIAKFPGVDLAKTYEIIWNHIIGNPYPAGSTYWWADRTIWNTIMPHIVVAILAGASLAVCGALMQALMTNPLADPYSTGISSGACFGAISAMVSGTVFSTFSGGTVLCAFLGAMVPAVIIIVLSSRIRMTPATLILLGTAVSYFFNALVTYIMVMADPDSMKTAYIWQVGSLDNISGWSSIPIIAIITIIGSIIVMALANKLNVISNGDKTATSLGIDVQNFRIMCLLLMAVMTAGVIAFTGIIGFIGLVAPHLVRLIIGSDNKFVIPISMAIGALLLLIADYLTTLFSNVPVGVITCIIGSPVFFVLIIWQSKRTGAVY